MERCNYFGGCTGAGVVTCPPVFAGAPASSGRYKGPFLPQAAINKKTRAKPAHKINRKYRTGEEE